VYKKASLSGSRLAADLKVILAETFNRMEADRERKQVNIVTKSTYFK
jgi:hypothetical protein